MYEEELFKNFLILSPAILKNVQILYNLSLQPQKRDALYCGYKYLLEIIRKLCYVTYIMNNLRCLVIPI